MKKLRFALALLSFVTLLSNGRSDAAIVTDCSEAGLRNALSADGYVTFACEGVIVLTNTIRISRDTTLDGAGHAVCLSGGNQVRVFHVNPGVRLMLVNLTIAGGSHVGTNGGTALAPGGPGFGGGIYVDHGTLVVLNSSFVSNNVTGGVGGSTGSAAGDGGAGLGAAIYNDSGILNITNTTFCDNIAGGGLGGNYNTYSPPLYGRGGDGLGGSIYSTNGAMHLMGCVFIRNAVKGGQAGQNAGAAYIASTGNTFGGALCNEGGLITIRECSFAGNVATNPYPTGILTGPGGYCHGGAICLLSGTMGVIDSSFTINQAAGGAGRRYSPAGAGCGGAVFATSTFEIENCRFQGNTTLGGAGGEGENGQGGAIFNGGYATIRASTFFWNQANGAPGYSGGSGAPGRGGWGQGGGISNTNTLVVLNSTFSSNGVAGAMGGYSSQYGPSSGSDCHGGAIFNSGICFATNVTFYKSSAVGGSSALPNQSTLGAGGNAFGGAFCHWSGTAELIHNTLADNSCAGGVGGGNLSLGGTNGGAFGSALYAGTNGNLRIQNCIVSSTAPATNCFGPVVDQGGNLSSDTSCNFTHANSLVDVDPKLGPLDDYGGPTWTVPLLHGSPALDAIANPPLTETDQRGRSRPYGAGSDTGAFESSPPYTIRGHLNGVRPSTGIEMSANDTAGLSDRSGNYAINGLTAGTYTVSCTNTAFWLIPSNQVVTVGPDTLGINFRAYYYNGLEIEPLSPSLLRLTYAGPVGQEVHLVTSAKFLQPDWTPCLTNTVGSNGLTEFIMTNKSPSLGPAFFRTILP